MKDNHFNYLITCIAISIASLFAFTYYSASPLLAMAAGVAPLIFYHVVYLAPKARNGLSQAAIDSVYYFGFLITVSALAISAISIAINESGNLSLVIYQFGIGLFATGYAVIARMHLSSIATSLDEVSQETLMKSYIQKSLDMVNHIDLATSSLSVFSSTIMQRTEQVTNEALTISQKAMVDVAKVFEQEMKTSLASTREGLTEIIGLVRATTFITEREELKNGIKSSIENTNLLNKALEELAFKVKSGSQSAAESNGAFVNLNNSLIQLSNTIKDNSGKNGAIEASSRALNESAKILEAGIKSLNSNINTFGDLTSSLNSSVKASSEHLQTMTVNTSKLADPAQKLAEVLDISSNLDGKIIDLAGRITSLGDTITRTEKMFFESSTQIKQSITNSSESLNADVDRSAKAASQLTQQLIQLTQNIIDNTNKVRGVVN